MTGIIEAERVIALHQKKAPVQTIDIAQELGIKVFKVNDWPDNVSAMNRKDAERGGESGFAIYVNGSHPRVRRRFTIAHKIAHFALHRILIGDGVTDRKSVVEGTSESVRVDHGGRRIINEKTKNQQEPNS